MPTPDSNLSPTKASDRHEPWRQREEGDGNTDPVGLLEDPAAAAAAAAAVVVAAVI